MILWKTIASLLLAACFIFYLRALVCIQFYLLSQYLLTGKLFPAYSCGTVTKKTFVGSAAYLIGSCTGLLCQEHLKSGLSVAAGKLIILVINHLPLFPLLLICTLTSMAASAYFYNFLAQKSATDLDFCISLFKNRTKISGFWFHMQGAGKSLLPSNYK